jgi:hypothetical protein
MQTEVAVMCLSFVAGVTLLLSSKVARAICQSAILHPREPCHLEICNGDVAVLSDDNQNIRGGMAHG